MKDTRRKAVVYLRRSTDRQEQSIEDQRKTAFAYAEAKDFEIVQTYLDDAISGTSADDRESFQKMVADARERNCPWRFVLDEIGARLRSYLSADGLSILRRLVRETVSQPVRKTERDVQDVRDRLRQIESKADELIEMMNPTNREFIDEKLARMKKERQALEVRLGELQAVREQSVDCDQLAEEITAELKQYEQALANGDLVERKAFVRAFVKEVLLSPEAGDGVVRIRKFPLPHSHGNGNFVFWYGSGGPLDTRVKIDVEFGPPDLAPYLDEPSSQS